MSTALIVLLSFSLFLFFSLIVLIVLWLIGVYNKLVKLKVLIEEAWSIVDVF